MLQMQESPRLLCRFLTDDAERILVVDCDGAVGPGASAEVDLVYGQTVEHLTDLHPLAVVLDWRDLHYGGDESLRRVLTVTDGFNTGHEEPSVPVLVVVSPASRSGLARLCGYRVEDPPEWVFEDYASALAYAEWAARNWLNGDLPRGG